MNDFLDTPVRFIRGVGEKLGSALSQLELFTVGDVLFNAPMRYENLADLYTAKTAPPGENVCIGCEIVTPGEETNTRRGISVVCAYAKDADALIRLVFFNRKFIVQKLSFGKKLLLYGKVEINEYGEYEMRSPEITEDCGKREFSPVYHSNSSVKSGTIARITQTALDMYADKITDTLPREQLDKYRLMPLSEALRALHRPKNEDELHLAKRRLIYEELLTLETGLIRLTGRKRENTLCVCADDYTGEFLSSLPFLPTVCQTKAVAAAAADMKKDVPMRRLLQGDVGSGKTAVASALMYNAVKNGFQAVLMAPTQVLAAQHYEKLSPLFEISGIKTVLLTGSVKGRAKKDTLSLISSGEAQIIIGTHALFSEDVIYKNTGLVVTDEQHRFGVLQRQALAGKGKSPHVLIMSATPIPRTLSMMIFGDIDVSVLDEKPSGRLPVKTFRADTGMRGRMYGFLRQEMDAGRQCFIVCPLIEDNGSGELTAGTGEGSEKAAAARHRDYLAQTAFKGYEVGLLHGKMKPQEKDAVMRRFASGEIQLLVCTVVIEVGIDVPNASVMVIEGAERFGLSQLHQLRGRVGRGKNQSYCILVSDSKGKTSDERLGVMCKTDDGFKIADEDLRLRGPGDFFGSRQSGLPQLRFASLTEDTKILFASRQEAAELVSSGRILSPEYACLCEKADKMVKSAAL